MNVSALQWVITVLKWYFRYFIALRRSNVFLQNGWKESKPFPFFFFSKRMTINNIILGSQVEAISNECVTVTRVCQKHKVHGCISATATLEWLWAKYEIIMAPIERNIRHYSQSERGQILWRYRSRLQITTEFERTSVAGPALIFVVFLLYNDSG